MASSYTLAAGKAEPALVRRAPASPARLAQRMSRHLAGAVITFALVQLVLLHLAVSGGAPTALGYGALAMVVLIALPTARRLERRWRDFADTALPSPRLGQLWARDVRRLWLAAIMVPGLWIGGAAALTGGAVFIG